MCQQQCTDNDKRNDKIQTTYICQNACGNQNLVDT